MSTQPIGRFRFMDAQDVNLDGFAVPDAGLGLVAFDSPADPVPSLVIENGRVVELDGRPRADFDVIDAFIATHGIDLDTAPEAITALMKLILRSLADFARSSAARLPSLPAWTSTRPRPWAPYPSSRTSTARTPSWR